MKQKHFMDIIRAKMEDTDLVQKNTEGFHVGDHIQITTKIDGANASIRYDVETGKLVAFSRKNELNFENTLSGFWNFVQTLNTAEYKDCSRLVVFGEWLVKNKVVYEQDAYKHWYVYDIFDVTKQAWMPQEFVKEFTKKHNLIYVNELYDGKFVSWEHVLSFLDHHWKSTGIEEGIVVKNQTMLNDQNTRMPFYLKIVNEKFAESMKKPPKVVDPAVEAEKAAAMALVQSIVTRNRVEKEIYKMRDEGVIPERLTADDMKIVARNLPKRIYDDCMKEELETVTACGEHFGKMCGNVAMRHAREIILGG